MHGRTWLTAAALLLGTGCNEPELLDISTGLYSLEVETITDTCEPPRASGGYSSAIQTQSEGLTLWVPTGTVVPRLEPIELGESLEATVTTPVTECEGGEHVRTVTVTGTSSDSVGVVMTDVFAGLAVCPAGSPTAPESDCRSERRLRYLRRETCDVGCVIAAGPEGQTFACDCPGADAGM